MPRNGKLSLTLAALAILGSACVGSVGGDGAPGNNDPGKPGPGRTPTGGGNMGGGNMGGGNMGGGNMGGGNMGPAQPGDPGPAVFRRLTRTEYNYTVRDLLGDTSSPGSGFPADAESFHSGYNRGGSVSGVDASRIHEASEKMASTAVASQLGMLLPCGQAPAGDAEQASCAQQFVDKFGLRAFRRPLTQDESKSYFALYTQQRTEVKHDFVNGIRVVLTAMLMSPNFLYRWETVPEAIKRDGNFLRFNSYEMASRLSYAIFASMPDQGLFEAAAGDRLATPGQIEEQVRRMMKDPKAKDGMGDFVLQWLDSSDLKDAVKAPQYAMIYTPQVADAMLAEAKEMFAGVINGDGKLTTLLSAKIGYVDADLAKVYQANGVTGNQLRQTNLNADQRAGILTQGAFLAAHAKANETNPITRGFTVANRILCKDLPLPPDDIPDPKPQGEGTTRQRFEEHGANPCAQACHSIIDPLGFSFENYDAIGAWRTTDIGQPVNAASALNIDGKMTTFKNATELMGTLASSKEASDCMARQLLRWSLRRKETTGDQPALLALQNAFQTSNGDLRELMVALAKSKAFTHRIASVEEKLLP